MLAETEQKYERFAGVCPILAGVAIFVYLIAFVFLRGNLLSGIFLMVSGLLTIVVFVALYGRLREADFAFALLALLLGTVAAVGSAVHGVYDLANAINPPGAVPFSSAEVETL